MKNLFIKFAVMLSFAAFLGSCRKEGSPQNTNGEVTVKVSLSGAQFDQSGNIGNKASKSPESQHTDNSRQRKFIPLNQELLLVAELVREAPEIKLGKARMNGKRAAAEQTDLAQNVKYKVLVFDNEGKYVTERDYTRGQESSTTALTLKAGVQYAFIAYSVNSDSALPTVSYTDEQNKTLAGASVSGLDGNTADFMYFRRDMQVVENSQNNLDVVLKHVFTLITTKIDASATGYNITDIAAAISPHYPTADVGLDAGTVNRTGAEGQADLSFSALNSGIVSAAPKQLNAQTDLGKLLLSTITIGPVTATNLMPLDSLSILPGVKYNLNLSIIPNDTYLTYQGQSAARINGLIWMRHNLGANYNLDPDQNPSVSGLHGNYYQWGRKAVAATATTAPGPINPWNTQSPGDNAWNSGTETAPVKTANDPCPSGYRVPTEREMAMLDDGVTNLNIGNWSESSSNYSAARVFKSNRNANVRLTFPIAGNRALDNGALAKRGIEGYYWSSQILNNRVRHIKIVQDQNATIEDSSFDRDWAFPLRCIAER